MLNYFCHLGKVFPSLAQSCELVFSSCLLKPEFSWENVQCLPLSGLCLSVWLPRSQTYERTPANTSSESLTLTLHFLKKTLFSSQHWYRLTFFFISFPQRFHAVMTLHYQLPTPPNLESVANFSWTVKIRQMVHSKHVLFSQGRTTEIIQCLFLFEFSQYYKIPVTSWDVSSFFPPGQKAILRGSSVM